MLSGSNHATLVRKSHQVNSRQASPVRLFWIIVCVQVSGTCASGKKGPPSQCKMDQPWLFWIDVCASGILPHGEMAAGSI